MSDFLNCIDFVIGNEGKTLFVDKATGERSKFGITDKFLVSINYIHNDPDLLTENEAKAIYQREVWNKYRLDLITSDKVAKKVFDMIVNMGFRQASLLVQRALDFSPDLVDGRMGWFTIHDMNQWNEDNLLQKIINQLKIFYTAIGTGDKEKFLTGWLNRAAKT